MLLSLRAKSRTISSISLVAAALGLGHDVGADAAPFRRRAGARGGWTKSNFRLRTVVSAALIRCLRCLTGGCHLTRIITWGGE
jgi:hypothetical protein